MLTQRAIYEFDDFRVDTGQFLLNRRGVPSPLTPTVFRILLLLLEHAGKVVTKEQLVQHVWPDSFVEEGNLNRNISTLRKALGEKPSDHRFIETVPKTGYRFSAPVRAIAYRAPAPAAPNDIFLQDVAHIIRLKLDRLDETRKQLLVTASVQGREFDSAVLAASMLMSPQDVEETLRELSEIHGLIDATGEKQLPDGKFTVRYRFVYAFCQEACYASLAPIRMGLRNASLADAFLAYYGN